MSAHNIPLSISKRKSPNIFPNTIHGILFCRRLKNNFEIAMVNKPSVFEPLMFYCTISLIYMEWFDSSKYAFFITASSVKHQNNW